MLGVRLFRLLDPIRCPSRKLRLRDQPASTATVPAGAGVAQLRRPQVELP